MKDTRICVIGLGYVGLPLARLFSTKYPTVGFDMNPRRVEALMAGHDSTLEVADDLLQDAISNHGFVCTSDIERIRDCNFYVVAVPTPVDSDNNPDLSPLVGASTTVGKVIAKGDVVVYESTVYPGVTEDDCIPVVENVSGIASAYPTNRRWVFQSKNPHILAEMGTFVGSRLATMLMGYLLNLLLVNVLGVSIFVSTIVVGVAVVVGNYVFSKLFVFKNK